ncbi:nudC domain-containing protein 1 isoform X1 [Chiloscyllium plagiosum]|uniref:nudC domain-containing protein 1 isoform X1 n=1 Tax=Chiloscyllium plagiosum TaxID=36176 RepID=UPI001CB7B6BA|nr:nudC domain-containing protein 1 isoform X1 [Chiloscyllium plagiosum]
MAAANCSLTVSRHLLDPKFDSYKLSLETLPIYTVDLDGAVAEVKLREDQYTLDHMCVFGMYNYLHCDRWYPDSVYYIDQHERIMHLDITLDTAISKPREVFRLSPEIKSCDTLVCASMHFTSPSWVSLSDGTGKLYLIRTGKRGANNIEKWEIMYQQELEEPFVIVHSHSYLKDSTHSIDVVLLRTEKDESNIRGSGFHSAVDWLTITNANNESNKYEVSRHRTLRGKLAPHYAAVEQDGTGLMIASDKPFKFVQIDGKCVEEQKLEKMDTNQKKEPVYYWQQTDEDLTVNIQLPDNTTKQNIDFQLSAGHLQVGIKGEAAIIEGNLYSSVDHGLSKWTINGNSLEVFLLKKNKGVTWPQLIVGDNRGEFIMDPDQASQINECLLNLASEELNADPEKDKPPCNTSELEECDRFPDDTASLTRFDAYTSKATHVVNLSSHQYLFTAVVDPAEMPCFCLRHDVDALLWQPHPQQDNMWEHIGTFNALGYVQASKREKKFSTCAPNYSYAALCECFRRVFIYRQPAPVQTVLYNRKEARHVGQVAKQQVASLETNDPVLGFQATNERLFVLTRKNLFIIKVNTDISE